jgi:hypothetical protein
MILDEQHEAAFQRYSKPLRKLERTFKKAGHPLTLHCFEDSSGNRMVRIIPQKASVKIVCIEGDSPAQAVKDVAAGVRL